jgi:hypothetical protein
MSEEVETPVEETVEEVVEETTEQSSEELAFVDSMLSKIDNDEVKNAGFWQNLKGKNANEFGQYVKELQSFSGKKGDIPKDDASDEEWNEFRTKLGWKENIEAYDFEPNDEFKEIVGEESYEYFDGVVGAMKKSLHAQGLSPDQAESVIDTYLEFTANDLQSRNKNMEEVNKLQDTGLRNAWGEGYDSILNGIKGLLSKYGMSDETLEAMESSGVLTEPDLALTLGKISAEFEDDPEIGHFHTKTDAGIREQLFDVNAEVLGYIKTGTKVPDHLAQKRKDLMEKLGDNL